MLAVLPLQNMQVFLLLMCAFGCSNEEIAQISSQTTEIEIWIRSRKESEQQVITDQIARFNTSNEDINLDLTIIPDREYLSRVESASLSGELPDILEFNGPDIYKYIWQNKLIPLEQHLPEELIGNLLPSVIEQGTYGGHLYSVATSDTGVALYANRQKLKGIDARIPSSVNDGWSIDEFNTILARLATTDDDGAVLDLKLNYSGEWLSFAFSPILQSAGADLVNRTNGSASGVLNSPQAVWAMDQIQGWMNHNYVDANEDDTAFTNGRVALSWVGNMEYDRYSAALGDDLLVLPLPDFGQGSLTGQGSWSWGVTTNCIDPVAATDFLSFILDTNEILAMSEASGGIPTTRDAIEKSKRYGPEGALRLFSSQLLEGYGVPRPQTPAYPVITSAFQTAFLDIINKTPTQQALNKAAQIIEEDLHKNSYHQLSLFNQMGANHPKE